MVDAGATQGHHHHHHNDSPDDLHVNKVDDNSSSSLPLLFSEPRLPPLLKDAVPWTDKRTMGLSYGEYKA